MENKMKHIHLNLKRFDIKKEYGGVNTNDDINQWASSIIKASEAELKKIACEKDVEFTMYFPEIHLLNAINARQDSKSFSIGCQGVYEEDSSVGGNFGAFTSHRTGNSMRQAGVDSVIIGHLEERLGLKNVLKEGSVIDFSSVNRILNKRVKKAVESGLKVLFCIGETLEERDNWKEVLKEAIEVGLSDVGRENIIIAYEPAWAIGPGKVPPTSQEIKEIVDYIKSVDSSLEVLYGGGLKKDNAKDLSEIESLDGGLIALTRFSGDIGFYTDEYLEIIREFLY